MPRVVPIIMLAFVTPAHATIVGETRLASSVGTLRARAPFSDVRHQFHGSQVGAQRLQSEHVLPLSRTSQQLSHHLLDGVRTSVIRYASFVNAGSFSNQDISERLDQATAQLEAAAAEADMEVTERVKAVAAVAAEAATAAAASAEAAAASAERAQEAAEALKSGLAQSGAGAGAGAGAGGSLAGLAATKARNDATAAAGEAAKLQAAAARLEAAAALANGQGGASGAAQAAADAEAAVQGMVKKVAQLAEEVKKSETIVRAAFQGIASKDEDKPAWRRPTPTRQVALNDWGLPTESTGPGGGELGDWGIKLLCRKISDVSVMNVAIELLIAVLIGSRVAIIRARCRRDTWAAGVEPFLSVDAA
eukprot:gnl/TRDRNA2_/TRDRNA2_37046_c0_seq2.p1 gnl/TRDRNA2_/TRDRNA2_37046_c0~~gnl/TRDRNA2_/TRDRNA2_37046_c0_seq2.p1  ORF type:complete len:364 (-),score=62.53 gnl/TRDRNA2_/TRDRNA2_37046_c0_seq2:87-1178(-)